MDGSGFRGKSLSSGAPVSPATRRNGEVTGPSCDVLRAGRRPRKTHMVGARLACEAAAERTDTISAVVVPENPFRLGFAR